MTLVLKLFTAILILHQSHAFTSIQHSYKRASFYISSKSETNTNDDDGKSEFNKNNANNSNKQEGDTNEEFITKDMFYRDMLTDPDTETNTTPPKSATVKRKKKNGSTRYRTLDNRDNLPFLVKVTTPDPYTKNDEMERTARKNTKHDREKRKESGDAKKKNKTTRKNLIGMAGKDAISSSIYTRHEDGKLQKVLGEFTLDKSTNNGDIIQVGGGSDGDEPREYQVQKSRCQYKYAGGKRFVMVRKILEVKEMKRVLVEQEIRQIFDMDGGSSPQDDRGQPPMLE